MGFYYASKDKARTCQYTGEDLVLEYWISNEGNFAGNDGAFMEADFQPIEYRGYEVFVEGEAPHSGELFAYVDLESFSTMKDGQEVLTLAAMIAFVKAHPLIDIMYMYDLASAAGDFRVNEKGNLTFVDGLTYAVELNPNKGNFLFYLDGLRLRFMPADTKL
jgi:hypothetical protein